MQVHKCFKKNYECKFLYNILIRKCCNHLKMWLSNTSKIVAILDLIK